MVSPTDGLPFWWVVLLSCGAAIAITVSIVVPIAVAIGIKREQKQRQAGKSQAQDDNDQEEYWDRQMVIKEWKDASQFTDCPWTFNGCENIREVLGCIWLQPLPERLEHALSVLSAKVVQVRIARVTIQSSEDDEVHFVLLYTLDSGEEIFGGEPIDEAIGVELSDEKEDGIRRRGGASPTKVDVDITYQAPDLPLQCLSVMYRVHDGFGSLQSTKHLPTVLEHPGENVHGSCFYVYPIRELLPLARRPSIIKFARVDRNCVACAGALDENPKVVFAERSGKFEDGNESPLGFVVDTICNLAGGNSVVAEPSGAPPTLCVDSCRNMTLLADIADETVTTYDI